MAETPGDSIFAELSTRPMRLSVVDGHVIAFGEDDNAVRIGEVYENGQPHIEDTAKLWAGAAEMFRTLAVIEAAAKNPGADLRMTLDRIAFAAKGARPVETIGEAKKREARDNG